MEMKQNIVLIHKTGSSSHLIRKGIQMQLILMEILMAEAIYTHQRIHMEEMG